MLDDGRRLAAHERTALHARRTAADRIVIDDRAAGVDAARAGARIATLLVEARLVERTLVAVHALRSAGRRHAHESGHARAHGVSVVWLTLAVGAAR